MADEALIAKVKETLEAFRPQLNADGGLVNKIVGEMLA